MPTPLENLQSAYAAVCATLAEITANPKPTYSVDGVSVSHAEYLSQLLNQEASLRKVPGVAPETNPTFTFYSVIR